MRILYFIPLIIFSCKKSNETTVTDTPVTVVSFPTPAYNPSSLDTTTLFDKIPVVNNLARTDLPEISGVAASRIHPGILYIHNDSGNPAQVYMIDSTGANKGTLNLTTVGNRDWEDIAVGPGPVAGKSYIYIADIGDNDAKYPTVFIYRFPEPTTLSPYTDITAVDVITLKYPDGPHNAETLMIDPLTRDIYIASKESNTSRIYVSHYPQSTSLVNVLNPVVRLLFNKATAGDISADGHEIILRSNELIWYWKLPVDTGITAGLLSAPQIAPFYNNEPQGEGICFAADNKGYYTDTEIKGYPNKPATISFYKRKF